MALPQGMSSTDGAQVCDLLETALAVFLGATGLDAWTPELLREARQQVTAITALMSEVSAAWYGTIALEANCEREGR
jgi:hypothetical protein